MSSFLCPQFLQPPGVSPGVLIVRAEDEELFCSMTRGDVRCLHSERSPSPALLNAGKPGTLPLEPTVQFHHLE